METKIILLNIEQEDSLFCKYLQSNYEAIYKAYTSGLVLFKYKKALLLNYEEKIKIRYKCFKELL